jgi:GntR family transcriptional regulator, transcriptional repressor for pyruvate dehydrogenase complex
MKQLRLADRVAEDLLQRIRDRTLQPGDRLPTENELCEEFGVSRTVVREATRFLVARGVVEVRAGSGAVVAAIGPASASESLALFLEGLPESDYVAMHEVRDVLEIKSARAAAERASDEDVAAIAACHETMRELIAGDDLEALSQADLAFHARLAAATGNEILVTLLEALGPTLMRPREVNLVDADARAEALQAHDAVLVAVQARDPDAAAAAMSGHMDFVIAHYTSAVAASAGAKH